MLGYLPLTCFQSETTYKKLPRLLVMCFILYFKCDQLSGGRKNQAILFFQYSGQEERYLFFRKCNIQLCMAVHKIVYGRLLMAAHVSYHKLITRKRKTFCFLMNSCEATIMSVMCCRSPRNSANSSFCSICESK